MSTHPAAEPASPDSVPPGPASPDSVPQSPVTSWGAELGGPPTLRELARRLGGHRWVEARAFELLGEWACTLPEPEVKALFGRHCYHHAWHAELLTECLPELPAAGTRQALAVAPGPQVEAFFDVLGRSGSDAVERLVGVYRVLLPAVIAAYRRDLSAMNPVSDAPAMRALELVVRDEVLDRREGDLLLASAIGPPASARAASCQTELERLLAP